MQRRRPGGALTPYVSYVIETRLTPERAAAQLEKELSLSQHSMGNCVFIGHASDQGFSVRRRRKIRRGGEVAVLEGRFIPMPQGLRVEARITLSIGAIIIVVGWLILFSLFVVDQPLPALLSLIGKFRSAGVWDGELLKTALEQAAAVLGFWIFFCAIFWYIFEDALFDLEGFFRRVFVRYAVPESKKREAGDRL